MSLFSKRRTPERLFGLGVALGSAGDHAGAEQALLGAARTWEAALRLPRANTLAITAKLTRCHTELGGVQLRAGQLTEALEHNQRAVALAEQLEGDGHPDGSTELGTARHNVAAALLAMGRLAGAATVIRQTVALRERLCANTSGATSAEAAYAESLLLDAVVQRQLGNRQLAGHALDTAEEIATRLGSSELLGRVTRERELITRG